MTDRSILQRNKAVLWARDILGRAEECLVVTGDAEIFALGSLSIATVDGQEVDSTVGKELVVAGAKDFLVQELRQNSPVLHDLLEYYQLFVNNPNAGLDDTIKAAEMNAWVRQVLQKMAGSSLVLDQADTGAGKWTSSHFKPNPSVIEKLKSIIQG